MRYRIHTRLIALAVAVMLALSPFARRATHAQVRPIYSRGASGLGHLLQRLNTTASAMYTAAHPDDEDSALISRLSRGDHARVAYLSLNRGEGGQNIIGAELFEPLGIIRTEELLQARRLDGGEQLFTRAFDYGFSKTRDEASAKWNERTVLEDMVRAIRTFRPLVIISRYSGTPSDGHGQHQLAGYLTPIAFRGAADPNQFPEQLAEGLRVWQARKLYVGQSLRANPANEPTLRVDTGTLDPLTGRSFLEIALEGRSQHKSQEMGSIEWRGRQQSGLRLLDSKIESKVKNDKSDAGIFDGIDTSITGIAALTGLDNDGIKNELVKLEQAAARALSLYDALNPHKIIPVLADGFRAVRAARLKLKANANAAQASAKLDADFLLAQKENEFSEALQRAAGVEVDALADAETIVPGASLLVTARVFVPENAPVIIGITQLRTAQNWQTQIAATPQTPDQASRFNRETAQATSYFNVKAPENAPLSQPYWLAQPRDGNVFRWTPDAAKNLPFDAPLITSETGLTIGGVEVTATRPVQYRYADDIRGEIRRNINVVPALSVRFDSDLLIAPTGAEKQIKRLAVRVTNNSSGALNGQVKLRLPAGWSAAPASQNFALNRKGERAALFFDVVIPAHTSPEAYQIAAEATTANGKVFSQEMHTIAYPHITTHRYYTPAIITAKVFDLKVAPVRVGYITGSGDVVPEAIERMNLRVTLMDEADIAIGDLTRFDVIVVGIRASEVRPDFVANNGRLLDYVRQGGTMIVQYQRPDYLALNLAPYLAKMAARVTDENAPVTILQPNHPAFNFPNKISADDWKNWVQERNLYALTEFDARYTPLLEAHDMNEPPNNGGEVYAEIGRGRYVYTSYAWFRQLPSGVPGAYRLFANLLGLAKQSTAKSVKRGS